MSAAGLGSPRLVFALAGAMVRTSRHAGRILRRAIRERKDYLIPQARSVCRQLRQQEEAARKGGAA